jgi:oligoendopeptidase F
VCLTAAGRRLEKVKNDQMEHAVKPASRDRDQIAVEYTWDLGHIYPDWDQWKQDLDRLGELMEDYQQLRGTLAEGPHRILDACQRSDELGQLAYKVYQYPGLMQSQDTRDNEVQARLEEVRLAMAEFRQATAWYTPELLEIDHETMRGWLDETEDLAPYRFGIEESYRMQRHVLDEDGERLLAFASTFNGTPSQAYSMMANADVSFPTVTLSDGTETVASHANLSQGLHSLRKQEDRETLFKGHFSVYDEYPNTYAAIYNGVLQRDWFMARARRYDSAIEAKLDDDNIPVSVVEGLIATARAGAEPLRRYHRIRKARLGVERYRYFDAYLPLAEIEWVLPYGTVGELIEDSVALFGDDYRRTVRRAFDERWIDVYENEGKRSGAFSAGVYGDGSTSTKTRASDRAPSRPGSTGFIPTCCSTTPTPSTMLSPSPTRWATRCTPCCRTTASPSPPPHIPSSLPRWPQ